MTSIHANLPPDAPLAMLLSAFAYTDEQTVNGESADQQAQRMRQDINALMVNEPTLAQWQVVWGPALDPARANMMYVAGNTATNQYAVVVRGSAWSFVLDWLEDFTALLPFVPCPDITNTSVPISFGASVGLFSLLGMHNSSGVDLLSFLATLPADAQIYITGHSLGGCLASVLAVVVANQIGKDRLKVYTFAAPSGGGKDFANYFNGMFVPDDGPSAAFRFYNDLDIVPNAWATLQTIESYYQGFVPCPEDFQTILNHIIQSDKNIYVQVGTPIVLPGSIVQPSGINPAADALFLWQAAQQHCKWTYCSLIGATRPQVTLTKIKRIAAAIRKQANQPTPTTKKHDKGMFLVTYHGGLSSTAYNNVYAYDHHGKLLSASVLHVQSGTELSELRGVYLNQGYLYVVNGGSTVSDVLCFSGSGASYKQESGTFVSSATVNSISHPFALAFNGATCFVSNQDTNVVAMLTMKKPTHATATKGAAASYLKKLDPTGTFLDGTFVASSNGSLPHVPMTTAVPASQGGLNVTLSGGKVHHSVRDILLAGPGNPPNPLLLYVADEPGNLIRLYDPVSGEPCGISNAITAPTHLLAHNGMLYVSAGAQIFSGPLVTKPGTSPTDPCLTLQAITCKIPPHIDLSKLAFAGMTVDDSGNFYIALRTNGVIIKYANGDFSQPSLWLTCHKHASPEFIVYTS
jgi:Lipase (class 3)